MCWMAIKWCSEGVDKGAHLTPVFTVQHLNSLWPSNTIWWHRSGSTLAQVMASCLTALNHSLNLISETLWHSVYWVWNYTFKNTAISPRGLWVISFSSTTFLLPFTSKLFKHIFIYGNVLIGIEISPKKRINGWQTIIYSKDGHHHHWQLEQLTTGTLSQSHLPAITALQGDCQWPLKNGGNSHRSSDPIIHCYRDNTNLYFADHKKVMPANRRPCLIPHRQSYCHQTRTV